MSMTNEDHNAEWELGDAITIHLEPEDPEEPAASEGDAAAAAGDAPGGQAEDADA